MSSPDDSLYPPGILIGQVTSVNEESAYKSVNVHPIGEPAQPRRRAGADGGAAARCPANLCRLAASLPAGPEPHGGAGGEQLASTGAGG